jgi:hypothetical protein
MCSVGLLIGLSETATVSPPFVQFGFVVTYRNGLKTLRKPLTAPLTIFFPSRATPLAMPLPSLELP